MPDALEWSRNNSLDPNDIDDVTVVAIVNLPGISIDLGPVSKEDQKNFVADAITWLQNNSPPLDDINDLALETLRYWLGFQ
jgi:hypothetical protein